MHIVILTPVLDDWTPVHDVLTKLDSVFSAKQDTLAVLLVDDGSNECPPATFACGPFAKLQSVSVLKLKKNLGHQRALAVGLCEISEKIACDAVLVMDGDGQDDPVDALRLAEKLAALDPTLIPHHPIIFAERTRRAESFAFRISYAVYRIVHHILTGRGIRFGNFSIIPRARLAALTTEPMLWNHYAASVMGSNLPYITLPTYRRVRSSGQSRLSYVKLAIHGISALSCYNEIIGVRLLLITSFLFVLCLLGIVLAITLQVLTDLPRLGWTMLFSGILLVFLIQVITLATNFTLQIISSRSAQPFLPARDYKWYVEASTEYFRQT